MPLEKADLIVDQVGYRTPNIDIKFIQSFDAAWLNIIKERGSFHGKHESKIALLQNTAVKLKKSKDELKSELKTQTLFVRNHRDIIESTFQQQIQGMKNSELIMNDKSEENKKLIRKVTALAETTMTWHHFLTSLSKVDMTRNSTKRQGIDSVASNHTYYSDIAMRLVELYCSFDRTQGEVSQVDQRAAKVENALLKLQIKKLNSEIERYKLAALLRQELALVLKKVNNA